MMKNLVKIKPELKNTINQSLITINQMPLNSEYMELIKFDRFLSFFSGNNCWVVKDELNRVFAIREIDLEFLGNRDSDD